MTRASNWILAGRWSALVVGVLWMGCGVGQGPSSESSDTLAFSLPGHGPGNPGRPSPHYRKREGFSFGGHGVPGRHGYRGQGGPGKVCGGTGGGKGTGGAGGRGGVSGNGGMRGGAGGIGGGAGGTGGTAPVMVCSGTPPSRALITDFADATAGTSAISFGMAPNIGGGSYTYAATGLTAPVLSIVPAPAGSTGQALEVAANPGSTTDSSNAWIGFGLGFDMCVDASAYTGVEFTITGALGNCALTFTPIFSEDNSVTDNPTFGSCTAASCYPGQSAQLLSGTNIVHFTDVIGGNPQTFVDSRALTGVQWQLNVPSDGVSVCSANFAVTNVTFVNDAGGAGGISGGGAGGSGQLACSGSPPATPLLTGSTASPVGGTFTFAAPNLAAPTVTPTIGSDGSIQSLQVTAAPGTTTDPFNAFSGLGLFFSSPACVNASAYSGVQFTVSGNLGTCSLNVFTAISEDNAIANGGPAATCTATSCVSPYSAPLGLGTNVVPFTAMSGGTPDPIVDATALNNVGWTLNVPTDGVTAPCKASFTIGNVSFVK